MLRNSLNRCLAGWLILPAAGTAAEAPYPAKPVRLVVGFPAGGPNDTQARLIGQRVAETIGQPVIVDNRAGADGIIGADLVARSAPDGYTILLVSAGHAINEHFNRSMPYDPVRDFAPVVQLSASPFVVVAHPSLPARSVRELIALARSQPGRLLYGSAGTGSSLHLAAELFCRLAGVTMVNVPYKGGAPATTDLIGGQVHLMFNNVVSSLPHVRSGRLRALGVTSAARSPAFPDTPAVAETVPGYDVTAWYGILAPSRIAPRRVARLNAEFVRALAEPEIRQKLSAIGLDVTGGTPERFGAHIRGEREKWAKLIRDAGIRTD